MATHQWTEFCKLVEQDDGLPVRDIGDWSEDKLFFWHNYIGITTKAMVGKPQWRTGLFYVDLFSGPGICRVRETSRRIPGSALVAAYAPKPFERILVAEIDEGFAAACESRLSRSPAASRFRMYRGDCNTRITEIADEIPDRALTLAFIDPEALDHRFQTIEVLAARGRVDLLILFADAYDIVRNVERYLADPNSKLDQVLGPGSGWRDRWRTLQDQSGPKVRELFSEIYKSQLQRHLGYKSFGVRTIERNGAPLYRLIYASKHERGLEFWDKISKQDRRGQADLF